MPAVREIPLAYNVNSHIPVSHHKLFFESCDIHDWLISRKKQISLGRLLTDVKAIASRFPDINAFELRLVFFDIIYGRAWTVHLTVYHLAFGLLALRDCTYMLARTY